MERLYDIKVTEIEMMRDRGFEIDSTAQRILELDLSKASDVKIFDDYLERVRKTYHISEHDESIRRLGLTQYTTQDKKKSLLIYYATKPTGKSQISSETVDEFIDLVDKDAKITESILVI